MRQRLVFIQLEEGAQAVLRWVEDAPKRRVRVVRNPMPDELTLLNISGARARDLVPNWRVA